MTTTFNSIGELTSQFVSNELESIPQQITIDDIKYKYASAPDFNMEQFEQNKKAFVIYKLIPKEDNIQTLEKKRTSTTDKLSPQDALVLMWKKHGMKLIPYRAKFVDKSQLTQARVRESIEDQQSNRDVISTDLNIDFLNPSLGTIEGKVDTGAGESSLHADQIEMEGDVVKFSTNGNTIKMYTAGTTDIQSADGGTETRPAINAAIEVNGEQFNDVRFNLNDRGDMPSPLLIGMNLIEQGNFLVDPMQEEEIPGTDDLLINDTEQLNDIIDQIEEQENQYE